MNNIYLPYDFQTLCLTLSNKKVASLGASLKDLFFLHFEMGDSLLFSLNPKFLRCHQTKKESSFETDFTSRFNTKFKGYEVDRIDYHKEEGCLIIQLYKEACRILMIVDFGRMNIILAKEDKSIIFSLKPVKRGFFTLKYFNFTLHEDASSRELDSLFSFLEEKQSIKEDVLDRIEKQTRMQHQLEEKLKDCLTWHSFEKEGLLLQANLYKVTHGQQEILVEDWEDGSKKTLFLQGSTKEESLKRLFTKAKRLKRGQEVVKKKLEEITLGIEMLKKNLMAIDASSSKKELSSFIRKKPIQSKHPGFKKKVPYREYLSASGLRILVGKSQKDNDILTFKVGSPNDVWLHTSDFPGSHVLIKIKGKEEPDALTIEEAALLAIEASQAKDKPMADVVITRQKFLKRVKGKPGQVIVLQKKIRKVFVNKDKLSLVKERIFNPLL